MPAETAPGSPAGRRAWAGSCAALEQIVAHPPPLAALIAEELGHRHEEEPPTRPPHFGVGAVGSPEERKQHHAAPVHVGKPRFGGALVMGAVPAPLLEHTQVVLAAQ